MNAGPRPRGNTMGPAWSIFVSMTPAMAALLLSTAAFVASAIADEPLPVATAPPVATIPPETTATVQAIDQRMEAYNQFRAQFDAGRFEEALPLAQHVVELSDVHRDRDIELPIAYNNLGATQFRLSDYEAAEASYQTSLALLEASQGISSRRMITPLAGLGTVYAALDQHALAVQQYERALAVSRRSEGLFNLAQLPLLDQSVESRLALGDFVGVEHERFYALRIAEQNYGFDDPRTLPAVTRLASFYESMNEFAAARAYYLRVRDISTKAGSGNSPLAIRSLVAIGRTHRMQYTMEPETLEIQQSTRDAAPVTSRAPRPTADRAGYKSIEQALQLLRAMPDPPRLLLAETLTELGDWRQVTAKTDSAIPFYTEASTIYAAEIDSDMGNPLLAPRMVSYRPPFASMRNVRLAPGEVVVRQAVFSFVVSEAGGTENVTVVTTDMSDGELAQSRRAMERAVYSPRFENGKPVATEGVQFTSKWYEQREPETASTTS